MKGVQVSTNAVAPAPAEYLSDSASEQVCRVCMETATELPLISPCKCTGTLRYIHEACLKTWILSRTRAVQGSSCEICKTPFLMTCTVRRVCDPRRACNEGRTHCVFIPILCSVLAILAAVSFFLVTSLVEDPSTGETEVFMIAMLIVCAAAGIVILLLTFNAATEACSRKKSTSWAILNQDFPRDEEQSQEASVPLAANMNIDNINQ